MGIITFDLNRLSFFKKNGGSAALTVTLSGTLLKLSRIKNTGTKVEVLDVQCHNTAGLSDGEIADLIGVAARAWPAQGSSFSEACLILPAYQAITKNIEIPSIVPHEIREIINLQAGRHTPYSREEIIVDYVNLGVYKHNYTKVLLVIETKAAVKRQLEIMERAGLKVSKVLFAPEVMAAGASLALKAFASAEAVEVLVHVDEQCTDFIVVGSGKPLFVRSIPVGSKHFIDDAVKYEEKFAQEIRNSLESYLSEDIDKPPTGMILAGAVEGLVEVPGALSKALGIPVRVVAYTEAFVMSNEVFTKLSVSKYASFLDAWSYFLSKAPLQTNLIPEEIKLKHQVEKRGRELIKTGILLLLIFVLFFFTLITKISFSTLYLQKVDALYQPKAKEARKLEEDFAKVSLIKQYLARRGYSLEVLTELYNTSTDELQLSDIRFDEQGKFTVRGTAETMSAVFSFVENLEKSKYFKDVKTKYTTKRKEGLRDVTDFEINAFLNRKGDKK